MNTVDEGYHDKIKRMLDPKRSQYTDSMFPKRMRLKNFMGGHWEQMLKKSGISVSKPRKK